MLEATLVRHTGLFPLQKVKYEVDGSSFLHVSIVRVS